MGGTHARLVSVGCRNADRADEEVIEGGLGAGKGVVMHAIYFRDGVALRLRRKYHEACILLLFLS